MVLLGRSEIIQTGKHTCSSQACLLSYLSHCPDNNCSQTTEDERCEASLWGYSYPPKACRHANIAVIFGFCLSLQEKNTLMDPASNNSILVYDGKHFSARSLRSWNWGLIFTYMPVSWHFKCLWSLRNVIRAFFSCAPLGWFLLMINWVILILLEY